MGRELPVVDDLAAAAMNVSSGKRDIRGRKINGL
jgi:hypothetical protein